MTLQGQILALLENGPMTTIQIVGEVSKYVSAAKARRAWEAYVKHERKRRPEGLPRKGSLAVGKRRIVNSALCTLKSKGKITTKDGVHHKVSDDRTIQNDG